MRGRSFISEAWPRNLAYLVGCLRAAGGVIRVPAADMKAVDLTRDIVLHERDPKTGDSMFRLVTSNTKGAVVDVRA